MSATIDVLKVAPEAMTPLRDITKGVAGSGLEASLLELVRMRASQINGAVSASPFITVKGGSWGKRRPTLRSFRIARGKLVYAPRACRARMDRDANAHRAAAPG